MSFTRIGDWSRASKIFNTLPLIGEQAKLSSLRRWSLKAEALAKGHMSAQDLGWTPLAAKTVIAKMRRGESSLILIATSSYFQSITSWVDGNTAVVGVRRSVRNKQGQLIDDIARTHEYGSKSRNIPARPLWKPTLDETMKWHEKHNTPELLALEILKSI